MSEELPERSSKNSVAVTAIVVGGIILLTCILAITVITVVFFINAPWATPF
jgi:hypothetical protein